MFFKTLLVILLQCNVLYSNVIDASLSPEEDTAGSASTAPELVHDLIAEPDFRGVQLKWRVAPKLTLGKMPVSSFRIRYCEITSWNSKSRCKERIVSAMTAPNAAPNAAPTTTTDTEEAVIELHESSTESGVFGASLTNLRMLTNYSISVWPASAELQRLNDLDLIDLPPASPIYVETKSFSARTSRCLANSSEIEVQTGPYFRGKISVEGANSPECAVYGNRSSEQSLYKFVINNEACGARLMNNSRIETMVIVHENKEILTHNSRRYLVICTFHPEIYSLTASVSVPSHLLKKVFDRLKQSSVSRSDNNYSSGSNNSTPTSSPPGSILAQVISIKQANTRNKMKRFSQSPSTPPPPPPSRGEMRRSSTTIHLSELGADQKRDSRALEHDRRSGKLTSPQQHLSAAVRSDDATNISAGAFSGRSSGSSSSNSANDAATDAASSQRQSSKIVSENSNKFVLGAAAILCLCVVTSLYLLIVHYRQERQRSPKHRHRQFDHRQHPLHSQPHHRHQPYHHHQQQQHQSAHPHQPPHPTYSRHQHRFDSLESAKTKSILNV